MSNELNDIKKLIVGYKHKDLESAISVLIQIQDFFEMIDYEADELDEAVFQLFLDNLARVGRTPIFSYLSDKLSEKIESMKNADINGVFDVLAELNFILGSMTDAMEDGDEFERSSQDLAEREDFDAWWDAACSFGDFHEDTEEDLEYEEEIVAPLTGDQVSEIIGVLKKYGYLPENLNPAVSKRYDILELLREHAERYILNYDTECIEDDMDYTELIHEHADITHGEFKPEDVSSAFRHEEEFAAIDFTCNGLRYHWEFDQEDDYVSFDFYENLVPLIEKHTSGRFMFFPSEDQCVELIFLNKKAADTLSECRVFERPYD